MKQCIYRNCSGKPECEHAFTYQGRQINEKWALVPVCTYHHRGNGLDKNYNRYRAILRATDDDFKKYPKADWKQLKKYLIMRYEHKS